MAADEEVSLAKFNNSFQAFNRGLVSLLALARTDIKNIQLSAEIFVNWVPRVLGAMMLRPGTQYIASSYLDQPSRFFPFVFSNSETALLELTPLNMRVLINDVIITRPAVASVLINPDFDNLLGWTINDGPGAVSTLDFANSRLLLEGTNFNKASVSQFFTVLPADHGVEHCVEIEVTLGKARVRIGYSSGGDEYISERELLTGFHSLAFSPSSGNVYIEIFNRDRTVSIVTSCSLAAAGEMVIPTPWTSSNSSLIRVSQSGDVIFASCKGVKPIRIERTNARSWSVVNYETVVPPFRNVNINSKTSLTVSQRVGGSSVYLASTSPLFTADDVGSVFRVFIPGQNARQIVGGTNQWTAPVAISGVGASQRTFTLVIGAGLTGTISVENSVDNENWHPVATYGAPGTNNIADASDNLVVYYRCGITPSAADYTSGSCLLTVTYATGVTEEIVKAFRFESSVLLSCLVLRGQGGYGTGNAWEEGQWSKRRGYPTATALYQGRLWWASNDKIYGSESDNYDSYDLNTLGDSGPIIRSIGDGPIDSIVWMAPSATLIVGGKGAIYSAQSFNGGPLTPTDFNLQKVSTHGSGSVEADLMDDSIVYSQIGGYRIFEVAQREGYAGVAVEDLTIVIPEIGSPGIIKIAIQRQPDTRIHCVRSNGTVAILVNDRAEGVRCWLNFSTNGTVVDVVVLPRESSGEDAVYYVVKRGSGANISYHLVKWALESECQGGLANKQADFFVYYSGAPISLVTGLGHLEGETVVAWADGADQGTFLVSGGSIDLNTPASEIVVGLTYQALWRSGKLALTSDFGAPLNQNKIIDHIGVILSKTHYKGLKYGKDFVSMDDMPDTRAYKIMPQDTLYSTYDEKSFEFSGSWSSDSRLCLQADAPRPCTVLAATISMSQNDR